MGVDDPSLVSIDPSLGTGDLGARAKCSDMVVRVLCLASRGLSPVFMYLGLAAKELSQVLIDLGLGASDLGVVAR